MVLGKLPAPGRPTTSEDSRAMTALVVGAGWGVFGHFFSCRSFLSSFSRSTGDGPIKFEILSQKAVKPITINQPTSQKRGITLAIFHALRLISTSSYG